MTSALSLSVGLSLSLFPPVHLAVQAGDLVSPVWAYLRDGGYGSDWVRGVAFDSQGVLAAAGMIRSTNSPNYGDAACLMRFGTPGWTHVVDLGPYQQNVRDEVNDRFHDVATDSQDNVVVVGNKSGAYYGAEGYHVAAMLRKYSPTGTLLWEKVQSFGAWSSGYGVCLDASDNIYVAGAVFANWTIEEGQWAIWKYDPGGTLQTGFPIYYNYSSGSGAYQYQDIAFDIAVDGAGGFLVVGRRGVAVGNVDWHVRKYDASRALVWQDTYSGPADGVDDAYRAVADSEGNFVVAGYTIKAASDYDWLVIKYRGSDGQRLWTRTYESAGGRSEACYGVAVDGLDNALVGGGEVGTDGKTHWRLEHLAKADGQLLAAQVWPSDQDEVLYAVAYRDRQIALGGSQSNGTNTDLRIITGLFGASLRVEPRTLDLGTVTAGSTAEQTVTITNVSAQSVTLGTIGAGDPLAAPFVMVADDCSGKTFAPGAGGTVTVAFRPTVAGRFTDSFDVPQAPPSSESYSVGVSGRGVEPATLASETFAYVRDGGQGSDWIRGVALDRQGVLAAVGALRTTANYGDAACVMRFGSPGWTNVLDLGPVQAGVRDEVNDRFQDVATDSQDNVVVVGNKSGAYYGAEGYHVAAMLRKYSPTGTLLWEKVQSFGAWSSAYGVSLDANDNIYVAGSVFANWTIEEGQWAIWKYDPAGALQTGFPIYYNFSSGSGAYQYQDIAFDLAVDGAAGFLVVGRRGVGVGNVDWHVRKYDASRALVWQDTYSGSANGVDDAYKVAADREGNFVVAGYTIKAPSDYDWLVIKYRGSDGQRLWTRTYESAGGRSEACYGVAVDGLDNALVGGGEVGTDGKTHWRLEHLAKADGQLLAAQVWPSDQDEVLYAVAYRDRQIALGGSQSNGNNTDLRVIVAVPPPSRITACVRSTPDLLSLQWKGAMEPVTLFHTPTLSPPDWQPLAGPLREPFWTGSSTPGFLRLRER